MKGFTLVLSLFLFCVFVPASICAANTDENILESIVFQSDINNDESIRFQLTGDVIPKISTLGGEKPRVILDFHDTHAQAGVKRNNIVSGELVHTTRMGRHLEPKVKVRVVIDIQPDVKYHFTQNQYQQENIFEIVLHRGDEPPVPEKIVNKKLEQDTPEPAKQISKPAKVAAKVAAKKQAAPPQTQAKASEKKVVVEDVAVEKVVPDPGVFSAQPIEDKKIEIEIPEESSAPSPPSTVATDGPGDAKLLNVTFENSSNKGEMVLFKLNGFYPPIVFGVEKGEPKVVCDFLDTSVAAKVDKNINCYGRFIKSIRVDSSGDPGKVRVVLNLMEDKKYDLQQVFFKEDNLFVLIVDTLDDI